MTMRIKNRVVTWIVTEWGVKWKDSFGDEIFPVDDKIDAIEIARATGGTVVKRKHYITDWK
jgi:hypothetical protein